jgi:hypothetical protein
MRFRRNQAAARQRELTQQAVEFAWRVHAAQEAWTSKVDAKAAIVLSLETAILVVLFAAQAPRQLLGRLTGWHSVVADVGVGIYILAMMLAALAVIPLMGPTAQHQAEHARNAIYFGHLRHWRPESLHQWLSQIDEDDQLVQLSRQLVELSRRNWRKHRALQLSILTVFLGSALIGVAVVVPR